MLVLVYDRYDLRLPVDRRVEVVKPRHAQDDIVADERQGYEIEAVGIRSDTDGCGYDRGARLDLRAICEGHECLGLRSRRTNAVLIDELPTNEVTGCSAVE